MPIAVGEPFGPFDDQQRIISGVVEPQLLGLVGVLDPIQVDVEHRKAHLRRVVGLDDREARARRLFLQPQTGEQPARDAERAVTEITEALKEQSSASTLIAQQVERIARMTEESQGVAHEVNHVITELQSLSNQMDTVMGKFKLAQQA